jgi:alkylhydroperoxidase family enzyme
MRRYAQLVQTLTDSVLRSPGATDPALRQAAERHAAAIATPDGGSAASLPPDLVPFVEKVTRHAYEITEDDLAALRRAGNSEEAIFEITISTALGAGQARLRRALSVLQEGGEA